MRRPHSRGSLEQAGRMIRSCQNFKDGIDVRCESRESKDCSRVSGLSSYMSGIPFTEMGTPMNRLAVLVLFPREQKENAHSTFRCVTFQMAEKYPREDAESEFVSLELKNRSALAVRKYAK